MKNALLGHLKLLFLFVICSFNQNIALGQSPPNLGAATDFVLFTAVGAFDNVGATSVAGDIGTDVGAFTGFPPGAVIGQIHVADAVSAQAAIDVDVAYNYLNGLSCGAVIGTTLGNNQVLIPNIYCTGAASTLNGDLILDGQGDPDALFIFKIDGAFSTSMFSNVILINSASLANVYWQVNGAFSLGEHSFFRGTVITNGAITLLDSSSHIGRGLSRAGAISLHNNTVTIGMHPIPSIIVASDSTTFCAGDSVILSGNVGGVWNTGASTPSITVSTSGGYFVTNTNVCGSVTSNYILVTVNQIPTASLISANGSTAFCAGDSVILSGNNGGVWSNGATTASITVTTSGDYFVTNTNACGSVTSNHISVTIEPEPIASVISANGSTTFCIGDSVILTGNNGGVWNSGASTSSITVTTSGDYFVTNTNACGSVTSNHISITIEPEPTTSVISASGPTTFCVGDSVILSGNIGGVWNNGATTTSITVVASGNYFVTNTNACGSVISNQIFVTVNPVLCAGQTGVVYSVPVITNATGYIWTLPAGATITAGANTNSITVDFSNTAVSGNISVQGSNSCGTGAISYFEVTINPLPIASIITASGATTFCEGGSIILSGNNGGTWSNGATTESITVTTSGDYFVINTNACGSVTSNHISVTVNPQPTASTILVSGPTIFCQGGSVILSGNNGGTWSNGATTASIFVSISGNYFITNTNDCGSITSSHILVVVNSQPTASVISASGATTFCEGDSVILTGNNGGVWSNGSSSSSITVNTTGDYFVTNTNACGNVTSNHISVTVNPLPTASVGNNATICKGNSVSLGASATSGHTYLWTPTNGLSSATAANPIANPSATTTYTLTETITATGCQNSNSITVTVTSLPSSSITGNATICEGYSTELCAPSGPTSTYLWSTGATTSCINVSTAGSYSVVVSSNGCSSSSSSVIIEVINCASVSDLSVVKTVNNTYPFVGSEVVFTIVASNNGPNDGTGVIVTDILQSGYTYVSSTITNGTFDYSTGIWSIGTLNNGASEILTVIATVNSMGDYVNTALISGNEDDYNLVNNVSSIETYPTDFFIPEGFSPNGDGINDVFVIRGIDRFPNNTITIFNRWGNKVFETSSYENTWDGTSTMGLSIGGDKLPISTYFYVLDLRDGSDIFKGTIYLNR